MTDALHNYANVYNNNVGFGQNPALIMVDSARPPMSASIASRRMDLPAPVSPVNVVNPSLNSNSSLQKITSCEFFYR